MRTATVRRDAVATGERGHRERRDRQHLQRVPPHDDETERHLLGAALVASDAARVLGQLDSDDFYRPAHAVIASAIGELVDQGLPTDSGSVAAFLREHGQLDGIRTETAHGSSYLVELTSLTPSISSAPRYADVVRQLARKRRILGLASEIVEGVYSRTEIAGIAASLQSAIEEQAAGQVSSWDPVNLAAVLAGEGEEATPAILRRSDGQLLLYRARIHALNAEPEAGKGWLSLRACLEVVEQGGHALYIDFEDDAVTAVNRLMAMGADTDQLLERFHYVRPEEPVDVGATARVRGALAAWPVELCVIDSVGEGMALSGLDEKDGAEFRRFVAALAKVAQRAGASVVLIDHLTKDPEKRGGYAIGTQAKKAALDVALEVQVVRPFGRDRDGVAKIWVRKDRHGHLRGIAADGRLLAEMHLRSTDGGECVGIDLRAPGEGGAGPFRPTGIMAQVSAILANPAAPGRLSKRALRQSVTGKNTYIDLAIGLLEAEGYIGHDAKGFYSINPFQGGSIQQPAQASFDAEGGDDDYQDQF